MGSHHPIRKSVASEPVAIPDKLYFRIGEVARLCQVPAYVLRFWETEFPSLKPNKGGTGQRLYRRKDVEMALRIKGLLYDQGYTIPGARQVFKAEARPREAIPDGLTAGPNPEPASNLSFGPASSAVPASISKGMGFSPSNADPRSPGALAPQSASTPDPGEGIRRQARLRGLRDDLRSLLAQLGGAPVSAQPAPASAQPAPTPAPAKPRPRLVLEPRQEPKPPASKHESHLHLAQGDLFSSE